MKQVILVRKDLNMSPGKAAAQCCHASVTAHNATRASNKDWALTWFMNSQTKVILMVEDEREMLEIVDKVEEDRELASCSYLVVDEGRTELKGHNMTTFGIGPAPDELIDKYTRHLKLYR